MVVDALLTEARTILSPLRIDRRPGGDDTLGTNLADTVVTKARHTLITSGPYRWGRHPFYVVFALAVAANSLVTANWFLALTCVISVALIVIRRRQEEEELIEWFGDEYRGYLARTGRFFPRLKDW